MDRIFFVGGMGGKGAPRNVENIKYDVKRTPRMSKKYIQDVKEGQKGLKYFILYTLSNHEGIKGL